MKISFFILLISFICSAQTTVEEIVKARMEEKEIPGFAFIISKEDKIIEEGYYGLANVELQVPVIDKSVFAIASMSKAYTAAAILLLNQQGKLSLNDPIKKYIPEAPESLNKITVKHLLVHTSGLPDDWGLYSFEESNSFFLKTQTDSAFLDHLFKYDLAFEPGTDASYSCGPFVLGIIIERISGMPYAEFMKEEIFKPLELNETWVDNPYEIIPNRVTGYFPYDSTLFETKIHGIGNGLIISPVSSGRADVGVRTTARDLLKFYQALLNGRLLDDERTKIMFSPSTLDNGNNISYSPGWMIWPIAGKLIYEHGGAFRTGFSSGVMVLPEDDVMIIVMSNLFGGTGFNLKKRIAAIFDSSFQPVSIRTHEQDNDSLLTLKHFELLKNYSSGNFAEMLNPNFPVDYLPKWVINRFQKIKSLTFIDEEDVSENDMNLFGEKIYYLRYYKINSDKPSYTIFSLDKNRKVIFIDHPESE
jgi:CubicO group peptidase (beta-lactamase class C family)